MKHNFLTDGGWKWGVRWQDGTGSVVQVKILTIKYRLLALDQARVALSPDS
jgi:hypothetical protein